MQEKKINCKENNSCTLGRKPLLTFSFVSFGLFPDSNLWFPLSPSTPEHVPTCASGHSATYDPDSKAVFVYGGLREGQRYSDLYILDTRTWRWRLVNVGLCKLTALCCFTNDINRSEENVLCLFFFFFANLQAKGNVPKLAYHSAAFYKKELFVFGGVEPSHSPGDKSCSNALYIFNPEFELWYQPIVEGDRPLPRFGSVFSKISHLSRSNVYWFF